VRVSPHDSRAVGESVLPIKLIRLSPAGDPGSFHKSWGTYRSHLPKVAPEQKPFRVQPGRLSCFRHLTHW
jgi:hypothetical protein